ncbi:hypothetical protein CFIMG_005694RA [Ceratocystis fimbriata CBS 114723]|uniref:CENP-V/GFA domain-containing protein n=1 Tax=Ceratocystis fimbriata CBS 114723 TaxID=1035309 RepID=A0A2C5X3A0_9PEZI|nr:hypothetical protein CFIMG_005694RA [Ceratocystis fimbriata CBS 114723]
MASVHRPLRGGCHCGRYRYVVERPLDAIEIGQVLLDTDRLYESSVASLLPAFLRVPLSWYHSSTYALFPDESHSTISRFYSPDESSSCRRNFCGFCGTPLSFWSEEPRSEAEYIQVSLGSMAREDLHDLEELGYILGPEALSGEEEEGEEENEEDKDTSDKRNKEKTKQQQQQKPPQKHAVGSKAGTGGRTSGAKKNSSSSKKQVREQSVSTRLPWFEGFIGDLASGGHLRHHHGKHTSQDGNTHVEWEVVELTGDSVEEEEDEGGQEEGDSKMVGTQGKRKLEVLEGGGE